MLFIILIMFIIAAPADYNTETRVVTFPPSADFAQMTIEIDVINDEIHEVQEGFFLFASVAAATNDLDSQNTLAIRNGVAMIIIFNDDSEWLGGRE